MPSVLPDTSLWVEFLRRRPAGRVHPLSDLIRERRVVVCGPVVAEVLAGTREPTDSLLRYLQALEWLPTGQEVWLRAGLLAQRLERAGNRTALTDLVIAVAAARAGIPVWTLDADFARIQTVLPTLELYEPPVTPPAEPLP